MKRNRNLKRSLAMFLAAAMCAMNMTAVTAFAADTDETPEPSVTVTVNVSEATVPDDADVETKIETTGNGDGSSTETTTTDKTWTDTETGPSSSSTSTEGELPGDMTDPGVADGEYTQVDTTVKVDTTITTEGSETKVDNVTTEGDGFVSGESGTTDGKQDVTTETTTETTTVTTTVDKTTGEVGKTDGGKTDGAIENDGGERVGETVKSDAETSQTGGEEKSESGSSASTDVSGLEITVGKDQADDEDRKTADVGELPSPESYLKDLAGYELSDKSGNVLGTVQADGKVLDADGNAVEIGWTHDETTGEYRLDFEASWTGNKYVTGTTGGGIMSTTPEISTGESSEAAWNELWEKTTESETLPDGTVKTVDVYTHKGTGTRVDTKTWTDIWTTVQGMAQDRKTASLSVSVKPGEDAVLKGEWIEGEEKPGHGAMDFGAATTRDDMNALVLKAMTDHYADLLAKENGRVDFQENHLFWNESFGTETVTTTRNGIRVRTGPGESYDDTMKRVNANSTFEIKMFVEDAAGNVWGQIGDDQWICVEYHGADWSVVADKDLDKPVDGDAKFTGMAVQSTVKFNFADGNTRNGAWFREMTLSDGTKIYTYCAEEGKETVSGSEYEMGNIDAGKAGQMQYIAENGYWGNNSSLDVLKGLLAGTAFEQFAKDLDEGLAMAVTQAAIWSVMNGTEFADDPFTEAYLHTYNKDTGLLDGSESGMMKFLFNALVNADNAVEDKTTDLIGADSITSTTIKVNNKVETSDAEIDRAVEAAENASQAAKGDRYDTDLSFTVAVVPGRLNDGGLKVVVYQGTDKIEERSLADLEAVETDGGISYTLKNVVLAEGVKVSIDLTGVQNLSKGAYLFRSEIDGESVSQAQVAVSDGTGTRDVNVSVGLDFAVQQGTTEIKSESNNAEYTDTWNEYTEHEQDKKQEITVEEDYTQEVTVTTTVKTETATETESDTVRTEWHDEYENTYERPYTPPTEPETPDTPVTPPTDPEDPDTPVTPPTDPEDPDTPDTEIPEEPTPLDPGPVTPDIPESPDVPDPVDPTEPDTEIEDPDVPLAGTPEQDTPEELFDIPDENIPLADVPQTGDSCAAAYLAVMSAISLSCAAVFTAAWRKRGEI